MKKLRFVAVLMAIMVAGTMCAQKAKTVAKKPAVAAKKTAAKKVEEVKKIDPWPWDFPQGIKIEAEPGQNVLSCESFYFSKIEKNEDLTKSVLIWYDRKMEDAGAEKSDVGRSDKQLVPNALIIPLLKHQKAKKGDILLTWWQSGSGLERAIVIDDSNPEEPVAVYLDQYWRDNPDDERNQKLAQGEKLKPNTFHIIKDGEWQPGATVAYREDGQWKYGILMNVDGDKVLLSVFASHLTATTKNRCKLIPFNEKLKVGDKVWMKFVDGFSEGYVVQKIDEASGHLWVNDGRENSSLKVKSIAEVTKVLD